MREVHRRTMVESLQLHLTMVTKLYFKSTLRTKRDTFHLLLLPILRTY
ncbi:MAG: hypothetical protein ACTS82_06345 [Arsenophonus sp. ET-DL12-MAG3]